MQVIVNINGRDALPVRSLPFVAGFGELSPDVVALAAHGASPHFDHERTLATYRVEAGAIERFPSPQWSFIADRIDSLSRQLRAGVRDAKETRATWQAESIKLLPESAFVWLDQFEDWFCRTRALPINEDGSLDATESATLDLHAWVPPELRPVVMEGFIHPITTADAEQLIGWCDATLNAATWWSLSSVTAQEAAALLCRLNPSDEQDNPLEITTDETNPNDFKLLKRVLEDVERSIPQSRTLADWLAVAHEKRLKHHSWAGGYEKARQALKAADASEINESTIVVQGRKALPLRLLPFAGRWEWMTSPDGIAHACSLPAKKLHAASGLEVRDREALKSFVFQGEKWREITTEEWDFFKVELDSLTKTLKADERGEHEDNKNFAAWRRQALEKLPARAFVWLDDFQDWFSATRPLKNCANTGHDDEFEEMFEKESDVLTLSPIIPNDLYALVFEGFSRAPVRNVPFKDLTLKSTGRSTNPSVEPPFESTTRQSAKGKPGRKPSTAPALLDDILKALEDFAASIGEPFDRKAMPGPLGRDWHEAGSFHWLCAVINPAFRRTKTAFEKHRSSVTGIGRCALAPWAGARPSDFYSRALPVIAPKLGVALDVHAMQKGTKKIS